jgi:pSer/pThr/pTyr-binding forkhead associated (FHA) protein
MGAPMDSTFVLRCFHTPLFRLVVPRTVAILGRRRRSDLVVDDRSVSRKHAEIRICGANLLITDLGSSNGTFVRDLRIQASEVAHGDIVCFGTVAFAVEDAQQAEPSSDNVTDDAKANARHPTIEVLSEAQRKVFDLLLTGDPEKTIARMLELSQHTVHNHVKAILRSFGVHSRVELLARVFHGNGH